MDHTEYPLLRDLSSKTTTKTELPICCPLTLFLEKQRNENKCHPSQMYIQEPALFSVLLSKHQCRQESFMTIIGRTIVEHTSLSASGAISYTLERIWKDDIPVDKRCFKIILIYSAALQNLHWELMATDWTVLQISPAQTLLLQMQN